MYSIQDLSTAKGLIEMKEQICSITGNPIVPPSFMDWANKVIAFFDKLYSIARQCTGHWSCRLSLAWREMKSAAIAAQKRVKKYLRMGAKLVNGVWHIPAKQKVSDLPTFRIHSDRSNANSEPIKLAKGISRSTLHMLSVFAK